METLICATHPARRATLTCERCGDYACSECAFDAPWGDSVCAPCKSRGGLGYPLAWERGAMWSPLRFARSARDVLVDAPTVFANLPRGEAGRAFGFWAWVAASLAAVSVLVELGQLRMNWSDASTLRAVSLYGGGRFAEHVARAFLMVWIAAMGFHLLARAFGGAAPITVAARTAGYASAFLLYNVVTVVAAAFTPHFELAVRVIATMIQAYFCFACAAIVAVEHYGVSRERGAAVAALTVSLLVPIMVLGTTLVSAASLYAARYASWLPR